VPYSLRATPTKGSNIMSMTTSELTVRGAGYALLNSMTAAWRAHRRNRVRRVAILDLEGLDDHMLKDMGIARSEIGSVVHGSRSERRLSHDDDQG